MSQSTMNPAPDMAAFVTRDELRADLAELRLEFRTALQGVQGEVAELRASVRSDIAGLRTAIAESRVDAERASNSQLRWIIGTILAAAGLVIAALRLFPAH